MSRNPKHFILRATTKALCLLSPERGLRFLFTIERWLYYFEGQVATIYGEGVHPKHRHTRYHDFFVQHIFQGERVLDVGCGNGIVAYDVAERSGAYVIGVDINPDSISIARQEHAHPRVEYHVADARQALPEGTFEVVILSNVLEHLPHRPAFLRQLDQQAAPERILIRVPLLERDWRVPLKRELGVEWRLDPDHETEYTIESLAQEIAAAGLRITHQQVRWGEIWAVVIAGNRGASDESS